ncbi:hypothetical protein F0562_001292 [Nyssa sinensis]|uniref:Uncharacterized protein n=1 Tax=Nyssa sinensis TaxID=561372 RepID=A0A5J5C6U3_9ASTE|nr:hypothetical protein F0562_001292 [Nyssa sinensis]
MRTEVGQLWDNERMCSHGHIEGLGPILSNGLWATKEKNGEGQLKIVQEGAPGLCQRSKYRQMGGWAKLNKNGKAQAQVQELSNKASTMSADGRDKGKAAAEAEHYSDVPMINRGCHTEKEG